MRSDLFDAKRSDPVDRCAQPDRLGDLRGPGFELPRQVGPGRLVGRDGPNHVTAADERRHPLEQLAAAVQHADPGRAVGLVTRPGVEIRIDRAELDLHLRNRLRSVDEQYRTGRVRPTRDLRDPVDRSEHVRDVYDADQLGRSGQKLVERIEVELPVLEYRNVRKLGLAVLAEQLPGDDVRVVLHLGQHHEVAAIDVLASPRVGDQIDRGGGVRREDRLLGGRA